MSAFIHWLRTTIRGSRLRVHNQSAAGPDQSQENNLAELQSTTGSHDSPAAPPALPEGVEQVVDGQVAFRDGEFLITPPVGDGLPPVLVPDDSVVLTIDGLEVSRPVSLLLGMKAEVRPRQSASSVREFHIEIAPDGMAAYLSLAALGPPGYRVRECGPARTITLVAEPLPGLQRNPTVAEIVHALHKAGVVRGIHEHEIRNALEDPGRVRVQVASGRLPTPGRPDATCLRDCRVEAGSSISAETVAASLRSALVLEVPEGGRIRIGTALTPTPVRIGNWCHILAPRTRDLEIESDGKGGVRLIRPTTRRRGRNQIAETRRT